MGAVPLADEPHEPVVLASSVEFAGRIWDVASERIDLGHSTVTREFVSHPGAVAVIAYNELDQVLLMRQYRHPVRAYLWEPPAGLLDVDGEPALAAAKRELWEEADLVAATWNWLADFYTSPGGSSELIRVFLARDIADAPADGRFEREAEERDMQGRWIARTDVLAAVAAGALRSPTTITGVYALDAARTAGWATLGPPDPAA